MSDRYYWLKLNKNFFEREEIKIIEAMPNGKDYIIFYLKLLLKSIETEGYLKFRQTIPYTFEMLSTITNTNTDIVRSAVQIFIQLDLMKRLDDGDLFLCDIEEMIGSEDKSAKRVRRYRTKLKELQLLNSENRYNVTDSNVTSNIEIEKEIDIDNNIDKSIFVNSDADASIVHPHSKIKIPFQEILKLYHEILATPESFYPQVQMLSETRKRQIKQRWANELNNLEKWEKFFKKIAESNFLMGKITASNGYIFKGSFDWVIKQSNCLKILEGHYSNYRK